MAWRLNIYFAKLLALCFLAVLSIMGLASFLVTLSEIFDRNFAHLTPSNTELIMLAAYNTPDHLQKVMPLIILLAAMAFFLHLARTQQLLMAQQAGIALTRLLVISIVVVLSLGTATITLLNPLAATLLERFDTFINRHIDGSESLLSVADTGIWLRQALKDSVLVIHARSLSPDKLSFEDVSVFEYRNSIFQRRIEARRALIKGNHWNMQDVLIYTVGGYTEKHPTHQLVTNINQDTIRDSFTSVSAVSIWKLHDFISAVENVGFDAKEHI
ncbi:MAG: LptF/LptG family permease, partial [Alphaproteobacteria bacterium]|nr:LptF/LptG family permease [Alphaproteobacteria bacterium]